MNMCKCSLLKADGERQYCSKCGGRLYKVSYREDFKALVRKPLFMVSVMVSVVKSLFTPQKEVQS